MQSSSWATVLLLQPLVSRMTRGARWVHRSERNSSASSGAGFSLDSGLRSHLCWGLNTFLPTRWKPWRPRAVCQQGDGQWN